MQRLDANEDDDRITEIQRLEDKMGSVDYDFWACHDCLKTDAEEYLLSNSDFSECPSCLHNTLKEKKPPLREATEYSSGLSRPEREYISCTYRDF